MRKRDDTVKNEKLSPSEKAELAVEAGIGLLPYVGGPLQTLYFGSKNEKRFKRIEKFYEQLNSRMEILESFDLGKENSDQLIGIIETIHDEIEKSKSQEKMIYFVNAYKNLLLNSKQAKLDQEELYVDLLSSLSRLELEVLTMFFRMPNSRGIPKNDDYNQNLLIASANRLADFGLLNKHLESLAIGGLGEQNYTFSITSFGISFGYYILQ